MFHADFRHTIVTHVACREISSRTMRARSSSAALFSLELPVKGTAIYAERKRRSRAVAVEELEHSLDVRPLDLRQRGLA